jgi:cytochrome c556
MERTTGRRIGLGLVLGSCLLVQPVGAQGDDAPTIKDIMTRLNKPAGLHPALGKALKAEAPAWPAIQAETKEFAKLAAALGKNKAPKGEPVSWETLTKTYAESAKALDQAAAKMDKTGAQAAYNKLGGMLCGTCHKAHRK